VVGDGQVAPSCGGEQFVHDPVEADDRGGFAFVEVAKDSLADVGAKFSPSAGFDDDGMAEGAGNEAAVSVIFARFTRRSGGMAGERARSMACPDSAKQSAPDGQLRRRQVC
jgi:hypothetical protein